MLFNCAHVKIIDIYAYVEKTSVYEHLFHIKIYANFNEKLSELRLYATFFIYFFL